MSKQLKTNFRVRRNYSKIKEAIDVPNLIALQKQSYKLFLQKEVEAEKRSNVGLQRVFKTIFPIKDYNDNSSLEFVSYSIGESKYDVEECKARGMTWSAPLKVTIQLVLWDVNSETGVKNLSALKEDEVYFGEVPLMTDKGTFVINGTERVVVTQLHRSPGVFFNHDNGETHVSGKLLYSARIIPYRGSWIDLEFDAKDVLHVRIDRRRKLPASALLRAMGMSSDDILDEYYNTDVIHFEKRGVVTKDFKPEQLQGQKAYKDIKVEGKTYIKAGAKFNRAVIRRLKDLKLDRIEINPDTVSGMVAADTIIEAIEDVIDPNTDKILLEAGQLLIGWDAIMEKFGMLFTELDFDEAQDICEDLHVLVFAGEELTLDKVNAKGEVVENGNISEIRSRGIESLRVLYLDDRHIGDSLWKTINADKFNPPRDDLYSRLIGQPTIDALVEIYRRLRPGDQPRAETAYSTFNNLFFNTERYDLSEIGRYKLNYKLYTSQGKEAPNQEDGTLCQDDIKETVRYILNLKAGVDPYKYRVDDIDHLGNRRIRAVGELVENQFLIGLVRMERAVKERMSMQDVDTLVPQDLINYKLIAAVLKEFFGSSQLSQFMDQVNPLSEITHKRRLSALGPGGLTRDRAGFEVRDVNASHYGRICPIETPEGPNIGLISSMAVYARVNDFGFIESPYRVVDNNHHVTEDVVYLSAHEEEGETIAQSCGEVDVKGEFTSDYVAARKAGDYLKVNKNDVTKVDVSPRQIVSVAAALIPFLENDDANRALMGSNMQRQAVPCLRSMAPLVGTGMEAIVARDSGSTTLAKRNGKVITVDANRIVVKADTTSDDPLDTGVDIYNLYKYQRSNQNTCINQRPIVKEGEKVKAGEVIADGPSTDMAELALGQNVVVAFMPWNGYNFEDSILINENLVKNDVFTSIHIDSYECLARDTKLGQEEITPDIPNIGEDSLKNLDQAGIIRIGTEINPGDILVGKVTPKSETQLSPEEKLLRAIFGEKAGEVRDTSLRLPPGTGGTVIATQVFSRKGIEKDERALAIEKQEIAKLEIDYRDEVNIIRDAAMAEVVRLLKGKVTTGRLVDDKRKQLIAKGDELTEEVLLNVPFEYIRDIQVGEDNIQEKINQLVVRTGQLVNNKRAVLREKIKTLKEGDELAPGIIKMVKVYIAHKRKIQIGDKLAGRHGNKGVLSQVVPQEDMPFLPDGTPVDVVLNPLGVPSRMNVGQILETHLGLAAWEFGRKLEQIMDPVVDPKTGALRKGAKPEDRSKISESLRAIFKVAYGEEIYSEKIVELKDEEIIDLARKQKTGVHMATPVFDAAKETDIRSLLKFLGHNESGKVTLYDGRSGEKFAEDVTVGVMYILKLDHLVEDKMHARSIGPYSLVTQQPLGGKAQFGGQRLGEMEVWALEAYGAAYALQEFLTVKSDDVVGRTKMYEAIVKGEHNLEPGLPESFNVMIKELQSLGLNIELLETKKEAEMEVVSSYESSSQMELSAQ